MKSLSIIVALGLAGPAAADDLTDFLGRHGCTIGAQSRAAALAAGFTEAQIDALADTALADGTASRQRAYVVLDFRHSVADALGFIEQIGALFE